MKYTLTIDLDNAAFADGNAGFEIARILREVTPMLECWNCDSVGTVGALHDINGNRVGSHAIEESN